MRNRRYLRVAILCFVLAFLVAIGGFTTGCARNTNPELRLSDYDKAVSAYNNAGKAYLAYFKKQPVGVQVELAEKVAPIFLKADNILTEWKKAEVKGDSVLRSIELWEAIILEVTDLMEQYGILQGS